MKLRRVLLPATLVLLASLTGLPTAEAATGAGPTWAPASSAPIHPGVVSETGDLWCTTNFVFTDAEHNVYLGQAAHCSGDDPIGTRVRFNSGEPWPNPGINGTYVKVLPDLGKWVGAGTVVYSSGITQGRRGESVPNNDFELVKVDAKDVSKVNPSVPFFGGPTALDTSGLGLGKSVYGYGNSVLRGGVTALSPKYGVVTTRTDDGSALIVDGPDDPVVSHGYGVAMTNPGIPGDSGSALLDSAGRAAGVLQTLNVGVEGNLNTYGDLSVMLAYAQAHSGIAGLRLVPGTQPFKAVPLG